MLSRCGVMNLSWASSSISGKGSAWIAGSTPQNGSHAMVTEGLKPQRWKVGETPSKLGAQELKRRQNPGVCFATYSGKELYQPFRPPPTFSPRSPAGNASIDEQLEILKERRGLWFSYATVIPHLSRAGFTPKEIDEVTGLNGHEQNKLVVGSQVRDSLVSGGFSDESLAWFDIGGEDCLYELRILSTAERKSAAQFVVDRNLDAKLCRDLAKSMKDFPRRKTSEGFSKFSIAPGDTLAFSLYRQSQEEAEAEAENCLNKALEYVVTDRARSKILSALGQAEEDPTDDPTFIKIKVAVVRLSGESPVVLPVSDYTAKSLEDAPSQFAVTAGPMSGKFNVMNSKASWTSWIAVPRWKDILSSVYPVAVLVPDGNLLPKYTGIELNTNPILLIVDKGDKTPGVDNFSLIEAPNGGLTLQDGSKIASDRTVLGKVLLAMKPPVPADPSIDPDWD